MPQYTHVNTTNGSNYSNNPTISIADELAKNFAKLKNQGIIKV